MGYRRVENRAAVLERSQHKLTPFIPRDFQVQRTDRTLRLGPEVGRRQRVVSGVDKGAAWQEHRVRGDD